MNKLWWFCKVMEYSGGLWKTLKYNLMPKNTKFVMDAMCAMVDED